MSKEQSYDYINLGTSLGLNLTKAWVGEDVSKLIQANDVSKVILLKAFTSAPDDIDARNIMNSMKNSEKFELCNELCEKLFSYENIIWHAVLITKDGSYFSYKSDGKWIFIESKNGGGFFKWRNSYK